MVTTLGFYGELGLGGDDAPSLREAAGSGDRARSALVAGYLDGGTVLVASSAPAVDDVLDSSVTAIAPGHFLTDGRWVWPASLGHYVRKHHVGLPPDFVATVIAADGVCPAVPNDVLLGLADELWGAGDS